ncbi:MAG TPA: DUF1499 domain-containing protein [Acidiferrobacteraceae bacterium]|nr:DUF1499 domain-containing protein [Acidiferrobacteraceae bacterium]HEX19529.1 DUF1499 domain-containing protein [Acidiferrobacteraceae bacterium]
MPELLADCPPQPHCVSSLSQDPKQRVAPLQLNSTRDNTMQAIAKILSDMAGIRIEYADDMRIEALAVTSLLRFKDDLTLALDSDNHCLHIRSCSRIGYYDFGSNRRRIERIRRRLQQHQLLK